MYIFYLKSLFFPRPKSHTETQFCEIHCAYDIREAASTVDELTSAGKKDGLPSFNDCSAFNGGVTLDKFCNLLCLQLSYL